MDFTLLTNLPYVDNSSILTVGLLGQFCAIATLIWKIAQVNTELQIRLHRMEYDINNLAEKIRNVTQDLEEIEVVMNMNKNL